ncbi:MAG: hypothetical protein FJ028_03120, partial [Chloroflexi bacterium]|nr:hypothetical protein [Chloroflexota bacterium]
MHHHRHLQERTEHRARADAEDGGRLGGCVMVVDGQHEHHPRYLPRRCAVHVFQRPDSLSAPVVHGAVTITPERMRYVLRWLLVGGGVGIVLLNTTLAALTFLVLIGLAVVAWVPRLGPAVLRRIGWARVPLVGGLTGIAASGALVAGAFGVMTANVTVSPPATTVTREVPGTFAPTVPATAVPTRTVAALSLTPPTPTTTRISTPSPTRTASRTPSASPSRQQARVVSVTDGDTIRVELEGRTVTVRYIGMDTPETVAPGRPVERYGPEATEANRRLVEGRTVTLEKDVSETDSFGRLLRYVYVDQFSGVVMVNAELVRLGYARVATYPPDVKYVSLFLDLEREARARNAGLWAATTSASPTSTAMARPTTATTIAVPTLPSITFVPSSTPAVVPTRTPAPSVVTTPVPTVAPTPVPTLAPTPTPAPSVVS